MNPDQPPARTASNLNGAELASLPTENISLPSGGQSAAEQPRSRTDSLCVRHF